MFQMDLTWKPFPLNYEAVEEWIKANVPKDYVGLSADTDLTLWFTSPPDDSTVEAVNTYWADIDENSLEAKSYVPRAATRDKVAQLRQGLHSMAWDDMSSAEKKIILGDTPTPQELGLLP